jgi:hypothetical protein
MRKLLLGITMVATAVLFGVAVLPSASGQGNENNITLCHGTSAVNNPYTVITVDTSGAGGQQQIFGANGHASHTGAIFDADTNVNGDAWGDIIPPFPDPDGAGPFQGFAGLNWTAEGQAIQANGCVPPVTTTPPPTSTTPPPTTTEPPTTTPPPPTTTEPPTTTAVPPTHSTQPPNPPNDQPPDSPRLAFTGSEDLVWIGLAALALLTAGLGLLRWGRREDGSG